MGNEGTELGQACPECGGPVVHTEGCCTCHACDYSKCAYLLEARYPKTRRFSTVPGSATNTESLIFRFAETAARLGMTRKEQAAFLGVSRSSYHRYLKAGRAPLHVTTRAGFLPNAHERLVELFGNEDDVRNWLLYPNLALGRARPLDLLRSLEGYEEVIATAEEGVYGFY